MVCQDARSPSGTKKGNVLVIFEKWPVSELISRDNGNFLDSYYCLRELPSEKNHLHKPRKFSLIASSSLSPNTEILRRQAIVLIKHGVYL